MKKIYLLILSALALTACNDDCDHQGDGPKTDWYEYFANGPWYEESENEEIRYTESGTFYDIYCKPTIANETDGRFEIDATNMRMTTTYSFMGQTQFGDWKIKETDDFHFTISSDKVGSHTYEKIVEKYTMNVGGTQTIQFKNNNPTYTIKGYSSKNEYIASVSSDGIITAKGEKGSTYIKVLTDKGNVWVKVVVGEEKFDLWYDYSLLIGKSYSEMVSFMGGNPSLSTSEGYEYTMSLHSTVSIVDIFLDDNGKVVEVALLLKDGSQEAVRAYVTSKYYEFGDELNNYYLYQTGPTLDESKAVVEYAKDGLSIRFGNPEIWKRPAYVDLWPDFTDDFGKTLSELTALYGEPFYDTAWLFASNEYAQYIYFNMDKNTAKCTAYVIALNDGVSSDDVIEYLSAKYYFYKSQDNQYAFYDTPNREDAALLIVYDDERAIVYYYDLATYGQSGSSKRRIPTFGDLNIEKFKLPKSSLE